MLSGVLAGALCNASEALCSATNRRKVAVVKVAYFNAIGKKHAVAKPIETVRQDDLSFCSGNHSIKVNSGDDLVAVAHIDLALVWVGKSVGLPKCHVSIIA